VLCFREALPVLEALCCQPPDVLRNDHETSHAALIFANQDTILKDIERLDIFVLIARNIVSVTNKAQNLAAEALFEQEILKYIELSTRVAARIYDGDANVMAETAFQNIAAACKYKLPRFFCLQICLDGFCVVMAAEFLNSQKTSGRMFTVPS
jgi:palmitoyltransferase